LLVVAELVLIEVAEVEPEDIKHLFPVAQK
jgi:hypothetical protein